MFEEELERLWQAEQILAGRLRAEEGGDSRAAVLDDATLVGGDVRRGLLRAAAAVVAAEVRAGMRRRVERRVAGECGVRVAVLPRTRREIIGLRVVAVLI